jgi:hypothetical protein
LAQPERSPACINPSIRVRTEHLGTEAQPLLIVENVLAEPEAMIECAERVDFYVPPHTHYPGVNANLPDDYYRLILAVLRQPLEETFGLSSQTHLNEFGFFGLSTRPAAEATLAQRFPHVDCYDPNRLAMVHYFCGVGFGGTGFFRQRATGFETVDQARARRYVESVMVERENSEPGFPGEGMGHYDLIGRSEAVFNRLIVYRSHVLHAPLLGSGGASADPRSGRLTANGFITPTTVEAVRR